MYIHTQQPTQMRSMVVGMDVESRMSVEALTVGRHGLV